MLFKNISNNLLINHITSHTPKSSKLNSLLFLSSKTFITFSKIYFITHPTILLLINFNSTIPHSRLKKRFPNKHNPEQERIHNFKNS